MTLWDGRRAPPPAAPASWDETPRGEVKRPPPRRMGKAIPQPGPVCPDCMTQLYLEDGRHDAPYCMGCGPDPGQTVHYVSETYLRERGLRRRTAAMAMAMAAAAYYAPRETPAPETGDLEAFLRYDVEVRDDPPADGAVDPLDELEFSLPLDDLPL
jgi:hypothetical protein